MSKSEEKKKQKRNQTIVSVFLVVVLFGSVFGVIVNSFGSGENSQRVIYNGLEFTEQNGFWVLENKNTEFVFKYNPNEIEKIDSNINALESYYNKPLYVYSDSEEAEIEVYRNLFYNVQIAQRVQRACLNDTNISVGVELDCEESLPLKTCDDNFVIISKSDKPGIVQDKSCVFIIGDEENLTRITDEFLFKILNIRQ